jgi:hypothetical protein
MLGGEHRERSLVVGGWPASLVLGHDRPEALAQLVELIEHTEAFDGDGGELAVELGQLVEPGVALDLHPEPGTGVQRRGAAIGGEAMARGGPGWEVHGVGPRRWAGRGPRAVDPGGAPVPR